MTRAERTAMIRNFNIMTFQPGGKYYKEADLIPGDDISVEGPRWLDEELTRCRATVQLLRSRETEIFQAGFRAGLRENNKEQL